MRRLGRWTLNTLTVLSLGMCVGTVGLWVRSRQSAKMYEWIKVREEPSRVVCVKAVVAAGGVAFHLRYVRNDSWMFSGQKIGEYPSEDDFDTKGDEELASGSHVLDKPWPTYPVLTDDHRAYQTCWTAWGFQYVRGGRSDKAGIIRVYSVTTPILALTAATAIVPAAWACACLRRRRRRRLNLCPRCNDDLRATPDRCPECGTATKEAVA